VLGVNSNYVVVNVRVKPDVKKKCKPSNSP
jgi:hypothetical protein